MNKRDIVVIGGSAGCLASLSEILSNIPADFNAAVFVARHFGEAGQVADILARRSTLRVQEAKSGDSINPGSVYLAVPGFHLLLHDGHMLLRRGPRENGFRPAIDALFRSAACTFGPRVTGVVLSGALNDGTAGLRAVKRCGGVAIVQDPNDATFPSMPESALQHVEADHVVPANAIASLLADLTSKPVGESPPAPADLRLEAAIAALEVTDMGTRGSVGRPSRFTCPECHGVLWEIDDGSFLRYRCHVGHAYTAEAVRANQERQIEELLWELLRTHTDRAALARTMATREHQRGREDYARHLAERARGYEEDAEIVRRVLLEPKE